jgi:hypothetical protein
MTERATRYGVLTLVAALVGWYYLWQARAGNGPFVWGHNLDGYYNLLAQGFASGHLYVPEQPSPQLLALPNPWDPKVDGSLRRQDMVLYGGHYYLYFGAAPAVLLFTPWRLLTGHDMPENFGIVVLCFGGFLFSCGALLRVLDLAGARPGPLKLALLFLALGVCQSAPFLLNRAAVYEIAIAGGYVCVSGGLFFLARRRLAASGLMFGLAIASRPHLFLAGAVALVALFFFHRRRKSRAFVAFAVAWMMTGAVIAAYNYARFGNPIEFGFRYQLAGPGQNRVELGARNLLPGSYYMLLARPELSGVFPWMRMVFRFPFDSAERHPLPPEYFIEPTVGALWVAPFLLAALLWTRSKGEPRLITGVAAVAGLAILVFLISTHLASHRYEVDFVPLLVFAAVAAVGMSNRRLLTAAASALIVYSMLANLALALAGPYDDFLKNHPERYVRLARRFSPEPEYRPESSPRIAVRLAATFDPAPVGYREPLVTIGHSHYCYFLYAERAAGGIRLVSRTNESETGETIADPGKSPLSVGLTYAPETGVMTVSAEGRDLISHRVGRLVAAPAQVAIGENLADMGLTARHFLGVLSVLEKTVTPR